MRINVPESHIAACDSCVNVVKAVGTDWSPSIESPYFQSPATRIPVRDSDFWIYEQLATLTITFQSFHFIPIQSHFV